MMKSTLNKLDSPLSLPLGPSELSTSWSEPWPVWKDYRIIEGVLRPAPGVPVHHYRPQDQPEIPFEIAKLATAGEADMVRFARQWGLLGYFELWLNTPSALREPPEVENPGDPIDWVRRHGHFLSLCISLVDGLARDDQQGLIRVLRSFYAPLTDEQELVSLTSSPSRSARANLSFFVNEQIKGIRPVLEEDGTISFKYAAMVEIAYAHVARLAGERSQIDRCEECGAPFKRTHGLQRFCPPGPFDWESRCSYRQRYKRFKSKEAKS